ncbi:hypothetical protein NQ176_g2865 [Zarea fungicola]|uniref:Uncharacterized protein n=1 Tax=Zarea fungicola TaxID=93591 RepID=A0ACC1NLB8_9HYPO|nr:hypothetical protein NQ176_g2865 [Lecanicillium fungicola]
MGDVKQALRLNLMTSSLSSLPQISQPSLLPREERRSEHLVREAIVNSALKNTELLVELAETTDAVGRLSNLETQLSHTELRVSLLDEELVEAATATDRQLQNHKSYRHSPGRRLLYTLLGKSEYFEQKAAEEEMAYFVLLKQRFSVEQQLRELKTKKESISAQIQSTKAEVDRHGKAHKNIDDLYASIFDGITPGHPDEDEQETRYQNAKAQFDAVSDGLKAMVRRANLVGSVKKKISRAVFFQEKAAEEAQSALCSLRFVRTYLDQAAWYTTFDLEISDKENATSPPLSSSGFSKAEKDFMRILSSTKTVAQRIVKSKNEAIHVSECLAAALEQTIASHKVYMDEILASRDALRTAVRITARSLEDERQGLYQLRQNVFEITVGFGVAAPAYHECCDRAAAFEMETTQVVCEITAT